MNVTASTQSMGGSGFEIGYVFRHGWRHFFEDIGPLLLATLIAAGLTIVSLGILGGPLLAGLYGMVIGRVRDGRRPQVTDVFSGFNRFWPFVGAGIALVLLIGLASLTIVGGVLLATIWLYVFPLMVDRGIGFGEAMSQSLAIVRESFWEHLALVILFAIIGAVADGPLALLSTPFIVTATGVAYFAVQGRQDLVERA